MKSQNNALNYYLELPASTDQEVIEWFQFIHAHGDLSLELVKLVQNYININQNEKSQDFTSSNINTVIIDNQANFFESLYNFDEATSATFREEKRQRKRCYQCNHK
jgi:hypothetical protein